MTTKDDVMSMQNCSVDKNLNLSVSNAIAMHLTGDTILDNDSFTLPADFPMDNNTANLKADMSCWGYWQDWHYPHVIRESYPVYLQERAQDKGKQAFEIIKVLKDKKLVQITKVGQFIDLMDELIKIL